MTALIDDRGRSLDRGQRRELQRVLSAKGYYSGAIDGSFGAGTIAALQRAAQD